MLFKIVSLRQDFNCHENVTLKHASKIRLVSCHFISFSLDFGVKYELDMFPWDPPILFWSVFIMDC